MPMPKQTVYTKYAFRPMPDACASGRLDSRPMRTVPMTAEMAVAM